MAAPLQELEGTWEEVAAHAPELTGRRVRLTLLDLDPVKTEQESPEDRPSTAASLLEFAGTWQGNDLEDCLRLVHETRSPIRFDPQ